MDELSPRNLSTNTSNNNLPTATLPECPRTSELGSIPVNRDGTSNSQGSYCLIPNVTESNKFNFSPDSSGSRYLRMADPTLLKIGQYYYVTGTNDEAEWVLNFRIYRSRNLVDWEFFKFAFDDSLRNNFSSIVVNSKTLCHLWSPQLYQLPSEPNKIYMTFTAVNNSADPSLPQLCSQPTPVALSRNTSYTVSIQRENFLGSGYFAEGQSQEPMPFGYTVSNVAGTNRYYDGGISQRASGINAGASVPTSLDPVPSAAFIRGSGGRLCLPGDCATAIGIDPFVFLDQGKHWLLYTWFDTEPGVAPVSNGWFGSHVAAYPMLDPYTMDALAEKTTQFFQVGFKSNINNAAPGEAYNGTSGRRASQSPYGIASGPSAFTFQGQTYITFSRNSFDSPASGIFYRRSGNSLAGLYSDAPINHWGELNSLELPLAISQDRTIPCGESVGQGQIFMGPGERLFLMFHRKEAEASCSNSSSGAPLYNFPGGGSGRTVFFKELDFDIFGNLQVISNSADQGIKGDYRKFIIPR